MFTPVPFHNRVLSKPVTIEGVTFPAGTRVDISPHCLHHNPAVWENHNVSRGYEIPRCIKGNVYWSPDSSTAENLKVVIYLISLSGSLKRKFNERSIVRKYGAASSNATLALSMLGKKNQPMTLWSIFLFLAENRIWYFMQIFCTGDNLHKMSTPVLEIKNYHKFIPREKLMLKKITFQS